MTYNDNESSTSDGKVRDDAELVRGSENRKDEDHQIWIAVGQGLGSVKNKQVKWQKLKWRLSKPLVDTSIDLTQYQQLAEQTKSEDNTVARAAKKKLFELKSKPGNWTAAKYKGANRKTADVVGKSCVVLDLDRLTRDQLDYVADGFAEINQFSWFLHTSRSHTPDKPRIRLVIPANRLMSPVEAIATYRFMSLYLAEDQLEAIEIPDPASFDVNQTMFWPSISMGQEFYTRENNASLLNVDDFLAKHQDWTNFEMLPRQKSEEKLSAYDPDRKMEDPREKPGIVGAFCRAFSVEDVIERWLSDVYVPSDNTTDNRYDYVPGSASNGVVVYNGGLFLHSNHGTDDIDTANAWDLWRIKVYGHLDIDAHPNTSVMNLPSSKAAVAAARQLPEVVSEEFASHTALLLELDDLQDNEDQEIADLLGEEVDESKEVTTVNGSKKTRSDWMVDFLRKSNDELKPVLNNAQLILQNDPRFKGAIGYNEFTGHPVCFKPIRSKDIPTASKMVLQRDRKRGRRWEDAEDAAIAAICGANRPRAGYEVDFSDNVIQKAVLNAGAQNVVNPIKDDIEDCWRRWKNEGSPTGLQDRLYIEFLKCLDTPFHREAGALLVIASIARTYEPGCKVDWMPVLEGQTGSGKSTFFQELFLKEYVTELKCDLNDLGRMIEGTRGYRFIEMAEMVPAKRSDANTLKRELSSSMDTHRMAYGRHAMEFFRQFLFGGTSNDDDYLTDPTSTRRFHVIRTPLDKHNRVDREKLRNVRHLIWGEAYQRYLDMRAEQPEGDLFLDVDGEVADERDQIAQGSRKRTVTEEVAEVIEEWLEKPIPACEVFVDEDGIAQPQFKNDKTPMLRNMVTAREAFRALQYEDTLSPYRNLTVSHWGKALAMVPGWEHVNSNTPHKCRRHGENAVWFCRTYDPDRWLPAFDKLDDEIEDLLA